MPRLPPTRSRSTRILSRAWSPRATRRSRCACWPSGICACTSRRDRARLTARMPMLPLIDRRPNGRGKSAVNRERFLRRYKSQIESAVKKMVGERRLADMEQGGEVRVPRKDISEPSFGFGRGGDKIPRPEGSGNGGGGSSGGEGGSDDDFVFSLSREEFMQIFFDDLELPNLARTEMGHTQRKRSIRAGFTKSGVPANLSVIRTLRQSLARRIALSGGIDREAEAVEAAFTLAVAAGHAGRAAELHDEL